MTSSSRIVRVGNMSASRADRATAMTELLDAGTMDVLALDMLSDEAVLQLAAEHSAGDAGYESALLAQLSHCWDRVGPGGVRVITNAGALDPEGLAGAVATHAERAGRRVAVAFLDPGIYPTTPLQAHPTISERQVDVAIIRHGATGIADALRAGADIVVTGRVSREALVVGAAMARHQWAHSDIDELAGAVAAGHVLSGGPGATGISRSSTDVTRTADPVTAGYPVAEIASDGTCVITKHPSALGSVTTGTVIDQLLDGIGGPRYCSPEVILRIDSLRVDQEGTDRVAISGARGEPPTPNLQVVGVAWESDDVRRVTGTIRRDQVVHTVVMPTGQRHDVSHPETVAPMRRDCPMVAPARHGSGPGGKPVHTMLGAVAGVRAGILDDGINLALWTWDDSAYAWLRAAMTTEKLTELLPEFTEEQLTRYELPNLRAVNFVIDELDAAHAANWLEGYRGLATQFLDIPAELLEVDP